METAPDLEGYYAAYEWAANPAVQPPNRTEPYRAYKHAVEGNERFFDVPMNVLVIGTAGPNSTKGYLAVLADMGLKSGSTVLFIDKNDIPLANTENNQIVEEYARRGIAVSFLRMNAMDMRTLNRGDFRLIMTHNLFKYTDLPEARRILDQSAGVLASDGVMLHCLECFTLAAFRRRVGVGAGITRKYGVPVYIRSEREYSALFRNTSLEVVRCGYGGTDRCVTFVLRHVQAREC
ncbi:MAG: hypothetical protein ABIE03_04790 [Patescibacteria group bacterium]|nr:hypothetical protein [Patescibacteria group bacterium]